MKNRLIIIAVVIGTFMISSCVTQKRYSDLETKYKKCNDDLANSEKTRNDNEVKCNELNSQIGKLSKQTTQLSAMNDSLQSEYKKLNDDHDGLKDDYSSIQKKYNKLLSGNRAETEEVMSALQKTQGDLLKKENELKTLEAELQNKKTNLDSLASQMAQKEKRLKELQSILDNKDKQVNDIKNKITDALLGFKDKGLSINIRNGKVYVSMEEKLLFASGSWTIADEGKVALKNVAKVLETNTDINVTIEGHTDNVPYRGNGQIKDNWDLSVIRATTIVKILLENGKIEGQRIIASGRSEYVPINDNETKETRSKNRRTEIILTPKLDEIFKVLESN